ncbi:MAG: NAD(+)/NADH kinase [Clostridiales bacterium]|jgi:NAD+ kinase|nr:NAD(+)/NADH kinase [Clostridiales bacterium]
MVIGIYSNIKKDVGLKVSKRFAALLQKDGIEYFTADSSVELGGAAATKENLSKKTDLIVAFGGDGTLISVAKHAAREGTPIVGVNMGNLGFLTETDENGLEVLLKALKAGAYQIETRALIEAEAGGVKHLALNEIVVKEREGRMAYVRLSVDGSVLDEYYADGVLVSTPTGSTAYSLAAGGPILAPDVKAFIINPLNPHSLHCRPFVVGDNHTVRVESLKKEYYLKISVDGKAKAELEPDEILTIKRSSVTAKFIRLKTYDFYDTVLKKFNK